MEAHPRTPSIRLVVVRSRAHAESALSRLAGASGLEVTGVDWEGDVERALARARPDLVLVGAVTRPGAVLAMVGRARRALAGARIVVLAPGWGAVEQDRAFEAGADAMLTRDPGSAALGTLLRELARGTIAWRAPRLVRAPGAQLTPREQEVLRLVASGASNANIGARLCITEQTVKYHLGNVFRKLEVSNRTQATRYALRFLESEESDAVVLAA